MLSSEQLKKLLDDSQNLTLQQKLKIRELELLSVKLPPQDSADIIVSLYTQLQYKSNMLNKLLTLDLNN